MHNIELRDLYENESDTNAAHNCEFSTICLYTDCESFSKAYDKYKTKKIFDVKKADREDLFIWLLIVSNYLFNIPKVLLF